MFLIFVCCRFVCEFYVPSQLIVAWKRRCRRSATLSITRCCSIWLAGYLLEALCDVGTRTGRTFCSGRSTVISPLLSAFFGLISTAFVRGLRDVVLLRAVAGKKSRVRGKFYEGGSWTPWFYFLFRVYGTGAAFLFMVFYGSLSLIRGYLI